MIHLQDIQQGSDIRNYPWQQLVNGVRRANNITVTPPLEMHQSWAGTVIGLNTGCLPKRPYWSAYGGSSTSVSATDPASPTVCTLSVEQPHNPQDMWTLSSNVLTLADTGDYEVILSAEMSGTTSGSVGIDVRITVETFDGAAWDDWTVLALTWRVPAGSSGTNSVVLSKTITEEVTTYSGGRQFRVSGYKAASGDATCEVIPYLTFRKC